MLACIKLLLIFHNIFIRRGDNITNTLVQLVSCGALHEKLIWHLVTDTSKGFLPISKVLVNINSVSGCGVNV